MANKEDASSSFDEIWTVEPERQNRFSSAWWFFYLFAEGEQGYGSEQMMVAVMANKNKESKFNGMEVEPMKVVSDDQGNERFNTIIDSWHSKEGKVTKLLKDTFRVELSPEGPMDAMKNTENGQKGLKMDSTPGERKGLKVKLENSDSSLEFECFNSPQYTEDWPKETYDTTKFGFGANDIDWTRMEFKGELEIEGDRKEINGVSYFARVCLHIPLFPWKWLYTVFPNGDIFIVFIPYLGHQHLRRDYKFSRSETLENLTYPISSSGTWIKAETGESIEFDDLDIEVKLNGEEAPNFEIEASKKEKGSIKFTIDTTNHIESVMQKPLLFGLTRNRYTYNQYPFTVKEFSSSIESLNVQEPENAHGTMEYSWGQWL